MNGTCHETHLSSLSAFPISIGAGVFCEERGNKHKLGFWKVNKEQASLCKHVVSVVSLPCYEKGPVRHFLNSRDDELYCFAVDKE